MDVNVIGLVGVFIPIVAIIAVFTFLSVAAHSRFKYRAEERAKLYETAKAAVEKGQPLPPEVIKAMAESSVPDRMRRTAFSDLRTGVVLTAIGVGLAVFGFVGSRYEPDTAMLMAIAGIPGLIGVALIILSFFNPNKGPAN